MSFALSTCTPTIFDREEIEKTVVKCRFFSLGILSHSQIHDGEYIITLVRGETRFIGSQAGVKK